MASVLVVDDEPDIRYLVQLNLELDGHRVVTAADGAEALAAVQDEVPDVVVLDVMMPGIDGWTVLEQLKADLDEQVAAVKVVLLTALGTDDDRLRGGIEGAVRYLVKPVCPDELRAAVEEVLAGGPELEQRRRAQTGALAELARRERGGGVAPAPHPRLTRLEHARPRGVAATAPIDVHRNDVDLTDKQRSLLQAVAAGPSVRVVADDLGVSRSNVYASLRRIARKLDVDSVPDLLHRLRTGSFTVDG